MSRISYRNYPVLKRLVDRKPYGTPPWGYKASLDYFDASKGGVKIEAVSKNFKENALAFVDYLIKKHESVDLNLDSSFDYIERVLIIDGLVYLYSIGLHNVGVSPWAIDGVDVKVLEPSGLLIGEYGFGRGRDHVGIDLIALEESAYRNDRVIAPFVLVWAVLLFKKYAQVEVVESKARTKIHAHGCKYLNETDLDIEYLDSKWFTSLVNCKGFKVGGHFRLQPKKKDGEWTKELIWIQDFEKKGYNRKAGILC